MFPVSSNGSAVEPCYDCCSIITRLNRWQYNFKKSKNSTKKLKIWDKFLMDWVYWNWLCDKLADWSPSLLLSPSLPLTPSLSVSPSLSLFSSLSPPLNWTDLSSVRAGHTSRLLQAEWRCLCSNQTLVEDEDSGLNRREQIENRKTTFHP